MKKSKFSIRKRIASFAYALNGLRTLMREEHNARIHIFFAIVVVISGFLLHISKTEWIAIVFSIGLVFTMELINSSIENLSDTFTKEKNDQIKKVKDLSAAGVLISALTALITGLIIFTPKILTICESF